MGASDEAGLTLSELRNAPREEHGALIPGGRPVATALAFRARQPR